MTDQFTYVSAFLSIVVALALTHLLGGIATILRARVVRKSWRHAAWMGFFVFACVDYWFSLWGLRQETDWSLGSVMFWLALAIVLYICTRLIVPPASEDAELNVVAFDDAHRRQYLAALFLYIAMGAIANLAISGFATAVWLNMVSLVLVACAWRWQQSRVQVAVLLAMVVLLGFYAVKYIPAL